MFFLFEVALISGCVYPKAEQYQQWVEQKYPNAVVKQLELEEGQFGFKFLVIDKEHGVLHVFFDSQQESAKPRRWKPRAINRVTDFHELGLENTKATKHVHNLAPEPKHVDKSKQPAYEFLTQVELNLYTTNETEFRQFILNSLPGVDYRRPPKEQQAY